jgi:hypothetical protein
MKMPYQRLQMTPQGLHMPRLCLHLQNASRRVALVNADSAPSNIASAPSKIGSVAPLNFQMASLGPSPLHLLILSRPFLMLWRNLKGQTMIWEVNFLDFGSFFNFLRMSTLTLLQAIA